MGQLKLTREYQCDNDCKREGCPGHVATLEFNSIANIYHFNDGQGEVLTLDNNSAQVLIDMFKFLSETRADTVKI